MVFIKCSLNFYIGDAEIGGDLQIHEKHRIYYEYFFFQQQSLKKPWILRVFWLSEPLKRVVVVVAFVIGLGVVCRRAVTPSIFRIGVGDISCMRELLLLLLLFLLSLLAPTLL